MFPGLRKVLGLYRGYRLHLAASQALMIGAVVCMLLVQGLNARLIDQGIQVRDIEVVVQTAVAMIAIAAVGGILFALNAAYAVIFSENTARFARDTVFRQIQTLSFGNIDRFHTSALLVRLSSDVENLRTAVLYGVMFLLPAPISIVVAVILGFITAPSLAPIMIGVLVILAIVLVLILGGIQPLYDRRQQQLDEVNSVLQEQLAGVRVVKAFVREDYERQRFARAAEDLRQAALTPALRLALFMPTINFVIYAGIGLLYWFGGRTIIEGTGLAVGDIVAFAGYLTAAVIPMALLTFLLPLLTQGEASVSRLLEVLDAEPEVKDRADAAAVDMSAVRGRVAFEHVSFGYQGDDGLPATLVLRDIDFVAEPGETVGFLGATGSGKTSLVSLVPRFYDVVEGRVAIDGVDVRDIPQRDLREIVGMALQEAILFSGDIRGNIKLGREFDDGAMVSAARAADAAGFVDVLPQRYDGTVARRGYNFSGGQRQRLSMARTLTPRPRVVILDDSTSALDVETESRVQANIPHFVAGATTIYVAQRISAVIDLDKIVLMQNGEIIATGNHETLIQSNPLYQEIYGSQLGGKVTAGVEVLA
jgi:ATP-binding cassette, subfamily B, bacterial